MGVYMHMEIRKPDSNPTPTRIEKYNDREMLLAWTDLLEFKLPFFELRCECPCAGCVDEHTGEKLLRRERVPADVRPLEVANVGRYALRIQWSDGHGTGMYHYDRLRELCKKFGSPL